MASSLPDDLSLVPGHEIVGRVVKTGSAVKKFKEGDTVGVGCMVSFLWRVRKLPRGR